MILHDVLDLQWIENTHVLWYKTRTLDEGIKFYLIDADKQDRRDAFDHDRLAYCIEQRVKIKVSKDNLPLRNLRFSNDLSNLTFEQKDTLWRCHLSDDYRLEALHPVEKRMRRSYWGKIRNELGNRPVISPDGKTEAFIRDYNVFVRDLKNQMTTQLSFDGSAGDYYSSFIVWSPDSRYLTTNKVRPNEKRYIHFVESAPADQLQPRLHKLEYLKPGDALPI